MRHDPAQEGRTSLRRRLRESEWPVLKSLALVGVTTIGLLILDQFFALRHVTLVYLVPVVIAATKLGIVPGVIAAIAGGGASAFFFYPPIYSFLVQDPQHLIELPLFVFVAIVTGHLATNLKRQAELARRRETEVQDLYAFSRQLAAAHTASDIYTAIRQHLTSVIGRRTILFETAPRGGLGATLSNEERVPESVRRETEAVIGRRKDSRSDSVVDDGEGHLWLVRPVAGKAEDFGVLAIDLGQQAGDLEPLAARQILGRGCGPVDLERAVVPPPVGVSGVRRRRELDADRRAVDTLQVDAQGPSSFAVVQRLRSRHGVKAGHAGTLDPRASGLLLVLLGSATRLAQ